MRTMLLGGVPLGIYSAMIAMSATAYEHGGTTQIPGTKTTFAADGGSGGTAGDGAATMVDDAEGANKSTVHTGTKKRVGTRRTSTGIRAGRALK